MKIQPVYMPPENCQRIDPTQYFDDRDIRGVEQCQGNAYEDGLKLVAHEFNIETLKKIDTHTYYTLFRGIWQAKKGEFPDGSDAMDYRNHCFVCNELMKANNIPVVFKYYEIKNNLNRIIAMLQRTKRIVLVHGFFTKSGHVIRVNSWDSVKRVFHCNDPYGLYPYDKIKKGGFVEYGFDLLSKIRMYRMISIEDK
jgi:hypothetical protein